MSKGQRVVVVEDDPDISATLVMVLERTGLEVHATDRGERAVELVSELSPDLVTLDLTLPDMDGTEVCRRLREFSDAFIMMITGRSDEIDRLIGLEVGADDYMAKPFSAQEVRARVAALLRRARSAVEAPPLTMDAGGGLMLQPSAHTAALDGTPLPLTPAEVDLMAAFASRPGETWTRGELVRTVWQGEFIESDFLVDVHVGNLRRKLRRAGSRRSWIRTVDGSGYVYDPS